MTATEAWTDTPPSSTPLTSNDLHGVAIRVSTDDPVLWNAVATAIGTAVGVPLFGPLTTEDLTGTPQPALAATMAAFTAISKYMASAGRVPDRVEEKPGGAEAEPRPTPEQVIALHGSYVWADKPGYMGGSVIRCACGWEADCEGHNGTTRRALWPRHVIEQLAEIGVVPTVATVPPRETPAAAGGTPLSAWSALHSLLGAPGAADISGTGR